jgi:hypothetical protein
MQASDRRFWFAASEQHASYLSPSSIQYRNSLLLGRANPPERVCSSLIGTVCEQQTFAHDQALSAKPSAEILTTFVG